MTKRTLASSLLFVLALSPLGAQPDPNKEELKLKLPKPMFIGTPTNIRSANLEVTGKSRGPFYVPKGTVLLSAKKKVTSSDMQPVIGELDMVDDGEKNGGDGYFIELGPGTALSGFMKRIDKAAGMLNVADAGSLETTVKALGA